MYQQLISAVVCIGLMCFGAVLWRVLTWISYADQRFSQIDYRARSLSRRIDESEREQTYAEQRFSQIERRFKRNAAADELQRNAARFTPGEPHPFAADAFVTIGGAGELTV